jgi:hypothetical protein
MERVESVEGVEGIFFEGKIRTGKQFDRERRWRTGRPRVFSNPS